MNLRKIMAGLLLSLLLLPVVSALAQDRAVLAFEAKPAALLESDLVETLQVKDQIKTVPRRIQPFYEADLVRGVLRTKDSLDEAIEATQSSDAPFDFYIRFEFNDADKVANIKDAMAERSDVNEKNGYIEMRPKNGGNLYLAFGKKWIVLATDHFDVDEKSLDRVTKDIKGWKRDNKALAQVAADVASAREFLEDCSDIIRQEAKPLVFVIPFIQQVDFINLSIYPDADIMMKMHSISSDEKTADKFRESITGLISMGKFMINQSDQRDPISDMAFEVLENLRPEQDDNEINMVLKRPKGLNESLKLTVQNARAAARKAQRMNDVRQAVLAMHNYESAYKKLPFIPGEGDAGDLSWRVRLLPFLAENDVYEMFDLQDSWDSKINKPLLELGPTLFGGINDDSMICWIKSEVNTFRDMTDGTSNTIAMIVVPKRMNWTEPNDISIAEAVEVLQSLKEGEVLIIGRYDGSVQQLDSSFDLNEFKKMLTPAGGEVLNR